MRSRMCIALSAVILASTALTGCGGTRTDSRTGTSPSPYATGNYPGHLKIGNPYEIAGRTYYPAHDPNYIEEGIASWYGPGFHGRSTANGERYDQHAMTAAHRTLPMPSVVRVTNLENGRTAVLKVNDRGPFSKDRIIDLSKRAAEDLGVIANGTARVRVEYLETETRRMIADLMRNNQLKVDSATLTMLAMNDLEHGGAVASDASPRFGLIASAQAAEPVYRQPQRGVLERAPLAPVASRQLAQPDAYPQEMQHARIERRAAEPTPPLPYNEGGVVPRTMPVEPRVLDTPPLPPRVEPALPVEPQTTPRPVELQPLPQEVRQPAPTRVAPVGQGIFIQAGAFSQEQNAHDLSRRLAVLGRTMVKPVDANGRTWYRVRLGPMQDATAANETLLQVKAMGLADAHMVRE